MNNEKNIFINENIRVSDKTSSVLAYSPKKGFRTEVVATDDFGNELFRKSNITTIGGAQFTLQKLFGCEFPWYVDSINKIKNYTDTLGVNDNKVDVTNKITQLFGVGCGGTTPAGDTIDPMYNERELTEMIPFQYLDSSLSPSPAGKYLFKQEDTVNNKTGYYLKKFENDPQGIMNWTDTGNAVDVSDLWDSATGRPKDIEARSLDTYVEIILRVSSVDCKSWCEANNKIAKINELALFSGQIKEVGSIGNRYEEVCDARMFSKIVLGDELLQLNKGITFTYRIYSL